MKKSTEHHIDELFNETFRAADADFDKDGMWAGIASALPGGKERLLFWLSIGTGIILLLYFVFLLAFGTGSAPELALSGDAHRTNAPVERNSSASLPGGIVAGEPGQKGTNEAMAEPAVKGEEKKHASRKQVGNTPAKMLDKSDPFEQAEAKNEKEGVSASHVSEHSLAEPEEQEYPEDRAGEQTVSAVHSEPAASSKEKATEGDDRSGTAISKSSVSMVLPEKPVLHRAVESLPLNPSSPLVLEGELFPGDPKWSLCKTGGKRPRFFAEAYAFGGYPLIDNSLNANPSNDDPGFLTEWNESESAIGSYALGAMFGIGTHWGGSFSAGLEFQQIVNKVSREQTVIEKVTVYDDMAYFYLDSNNNKVWVGDTVTSTRIYNQKIQMEKKHTLVSIPILLGYHIQKDRWRLGVTAGVNVHIYNRFDGWVLDPSGQVVDGSTGNNFEAYKTDMDLSIIGGFDFGYLVGNQFEFYLSPRFRYNADSWLKSSHPIESRIQLAGLRGGVRYHF